MRRTQNEVFELETDARQPVTLIASFHARPTNQTPILAPRCLLTQERAPHILQVGCLHVPLARIFRDPSQRHGCRRILHPYILHRRS
jgi:hypothetical protein